MEQEIRLILEYNLQWFAKDGPGGEKTEPATEKKLREAREDGKVAKSKELTSAFDLIVLFLVLKIFISWVGGGFIEAYQYVYKTIPEFVTAMSAEASVHEVSVYLQSIFWMMLKLVAPFFAFGFVITIIISIIQVGWKVSAKPLKPKGDKFNPISGFKRIFSKDSVFELFKSILKIGVVIYVAYISIRDEADDIFILYDMPLNQALALCGDVIINAGLKISLVYLVVGLADFIYQKHRFNEEMKMTKQEVKEE